MTPFSKTTSSILEDFYTETHGGKEPDDIDTLSIAETLSALEEAHKSEIRHSIPGYIPDIDEVAAYGAGINIPNHEYQAGWNAAVDKLKKQLEIG